MSGATVERIKERLSISDVLGTYLKLENAGLNLKAKCPFHNEKTPSFFVSPARGSYYCFGCGAKGDIFTFVQEFEGVDFMGALKTLASRAGVPLEKEQPGVKKENDRLHELMEAVTSWYEANLKKHPEAGAYLKKRAFEDETVHSWRIGFAPDSWRDGRTYLKSLGFSDAELVKIGLLRNGTDGREPYDWFRSRIMFPIFDTSGRTVGFSARLFGHEEREGLPKYINSPETPLFAKSKLLYGLHLAKNSIRKRNYSILVEGQVDVVLSHQAGFDNTVASSGTALTIDQLEQLKRLSSNIIMAFDADNAGANAAIRSSRLALTLGMDVKIARLPQGVDPADAVGKDKRIWIEAIRDAVPLITFYTDLVIGTTKDVRKRDREIVSRVLPLVAAMKSATEQSRAIAEIAFKTGQREEALMQDVSRVDLMKETKNMGSSKEKGEVVSSSIIIKGQSIIRRIVALLMWQETLAKPNINISELKERLRELDSDIAVRLLEFETERDVLIYEAEVLYEASGITEREVAELVWVAKKNNIKSQYELARAELLKAEKEGNEARARELLIRCNELSKALEDSPPKR